MRFFAVIVVVGAVLIVLGWVSVSIHVPGAGEGTARGQPVTVLIPDETMSGRSARGELTYLYRGILERAASEGALVYVLRGDAQGTNQIPVGSPTSFDLGPAAGNSLVEENITAEAMLSVAEQLCPAPEVEWSEGSDVLGAIAAALRLGADRVVVLGDGIEETPSLDLRRALEHTDADALVDVALSAYPELEHLAAVDLEIIGAAAGPDGEVPEWLPGRLAAFYQVLADRVGARLTYNTGAVSSSTGEDICTGLDPMEVSS